MSGKGALGWLILAVALAVPAFMFWNWWKLLDNKPVEFSRKPTSGPVFDNTKMAQNLPNPVAASTAAAAGQVAGSTAAAAGQPARPPEGSASGNAFAAQNPPAAATPAPSPAPSGAPGGAPAPAASTGTLVAALPPGARAVQNVLKYAPKVHRDPMLSPMDIKRLAQIELEKEDERRRLEEAERKRHERPKAVKRYVPPIESRVRLYGITAAPGSITAIIEVDEGESTIVRAGDLLPSKVKILRITQTTVTFGYKGKQFKKSLSQ